jgi:hypothetical protein
MKQKRIAKYAGATFFSFTLFAIIGCAATGTVTKEIQTLSKEQVAVTSPFMLYNIIEIPNNEEAFEQNLYIGNIKFSGGFVLNEKKGSRVESKHVILNKQDYYEQRSSSQLYSIIEAAAEKIKYNVIFLEHEQLPSLSYHELAEIKAEKNLLLKEEEDYGKNNINLPAFTYSIERIKPPSLQELRSAVPAAFLLVPIIEYYYSHSAGWFNEQYAGCGAGLRFAFQVYIFDLSTGKPVFRFREEKRVIEPYDSILSDYKLEQHFSLLEQEVKKALIRALPGK